MINITQLKQLAQRIIDNTDAVHYEWITTESELSKKMHKLSASQFPLLVVVTPSYDAKATDEDNAWDINHLLFFVLKRDQFQGANETNNAADMDQTLAIIKDIKNHLKNGFPDFQDCTLMNGIDPGSFHVDPEYNFLGCNGWSISFQIKTT